MTIAPGRKPVRVVVDTNVLISAILFGGNPERLLDLAEEGRIQLILSPDIIDELKGVLMKKFGFDQNMVEATASFVQELSEIVVPSQKLEIIRRDADNRILECAIEGGASYIISGDKRHILPLKEFRGIKVLSPADFLRLMESEV